MRLTEEQRQSIVRAVRRRFGPTARVLLFGSRVDDAKRGGDIDLLVETESVDADTAAALDLKFRTVADIQKAVGDRKIDLVVANAATSKPVVRQAREQGVEL